MSDESGRAAERQIGRFRAVVENQGDVEVCYLAIPANLLNLAAAVLAILVVSRLDAMQKERVASIQPENQASSTA